jgi:hypothetical protein
LVKWINNEFPFALKQKLGKLKSETEIKKKSYHVLLSIKTTKTKMDTNQNDCQKGKFYLL